MIEKINNYFYLILNYTQEEKENLKLIIAEKLQLDIMSQDLE
jgi:hypothetical protein